MNACFFSVIFVKLSEIRVVLLISMRGKLLITYSGPQILKKNKILITMDSGNNFVHRGVRLWLMIWHLFKYLSCVFRWQVLRANDIQTLYTSGR